MGRLRTNNARSALSFSSIPNPKEISVWGDRTKPKSKDEPDSGRVAYPARLGQRWISFLAFKRFFELWCEGVRIGLRSGVSENPPVEVQRSGTGTVKRFYASGARHFLGAPELFSSWDRRDKEGDR